MKYIILIIVGLFAGCSSPKYFPYKDTKDSKDEGVIVEWEF
tara:strand:- start:2374 stop:2496 length:123 start_codon:yes stop_codon:yes gene_type:complete